MGFRLTLWLTWLKISEIILTGRKTQIKNNKKKNGAQTNLHIRTSIKVNSFDTEALFLDLHLTILDGFVSSKIYDKREDFDFDIVNSPFLGIFLSLHLKGFIYGSLFGLLKCLMSLTLTLEIKF